MSSSIALRPFVPSDSLNLVELFYDTVHSVNSKDYTPEQLDAWISSREDMDGYWLERFSTSETFVAVLDGSVIAGFGNLEKNNRQIGMLYVHLDHQTEALPRSF